MPIPATASHDVFLRALLALQAEDFDLPVAVEDVFKSIPNAERDEHSPSTLPKAVFRDIRFLERHRLLTFDNSNPHVRLTPLGVYAALLFEPLS